MSLVSHEATPTADSTTAGRQLLGGTVGSIVSVAVILTLGLLAFAPLGAAAPEVGIPAAFTAAVVGGLVMVLLSRAALPAAGPSSATALILAALVAELARDPQLQVTQPAGIALVLAATGTSVALMGLLQIGFGLLRLGTLAKYVPQPVLAGFMNGIAVLILIAQVPPLLGLSREDWVREGLGALAQMQPATLAIGVLTAAVVLAVARRFPRAPAMLVGLAAGCAAFALAQWLAPATAYGPQAGSLPHGLPLPTALLPLADAGGALLARHLDAVLLTALLLALIGSLESVLSGLAVDQMMDTRSDPNRELVALGGANLASGAFGGVPLVYLRARALATLQAGGRTRLAAAAGCVALGLLFYAGAALLALLPLTVLAGVMVTIAFGLMDRWTRQLLDHWRRGDHPQEARRSLLIVAAVCAVTVWLGFVAGVLLGFVLATLDFARTLQQRLLRATYSGAQRPSRRIYPPAQEAVLAGQRRRIVVLELEGALFFGSAQHLASAIEKLQPAPSHLILDFSRVSAIDSTGAVVLGQLSLRLARGDVTLILAAVSSGDRHGAALTAHGVLASEDDWAEDVDRALEIAERQLLARAGVPLVHGAVALADCDLMQGLSAAQVARVRAAMREQHLAAGERLFAAGEAGDELFLLTAGSLSVIGRGGGGRIAQRFLSFSAGMTFGEVALLDGSGRSADAIADTDASVLALSRSALAQIERDDPIAVSRLYRNLALHLSVRLRNAAGAWRGDAA